MSTTGQERPSPVSARRPRRAARLVLRSAVLGTTVFLAAALTGMVLSSAPPADLINDPTPAESTLKPASSGTSEVAHSRDPVAATDATFARSMVYSGVVALAVSITGTVMVVRRRRHW